jgi:hypothetical protein
MKQKAEGTEKVRLGLLVPFFSFRAAGVAAPAPPAPLPFRFFFLAAPVEYLRTSQLTFTNEEP